MPGHVSSARTACAEISGNPASVRRSKVPTRAEASDLAGAGP